jgi:molybdenum cofactor biosynthesis enzyme MoaA
LLNRFEIAETETFQRSISKKEISKIYNKIKTYVYPQLRNLKVNLKIFTGIESENIVFFIRLMKNKY